jgi:hypothetical protein
MEILFKDFVSVINLGREKGREEGERKRGSLGKSLEGRKR